MNPRLHVSNRKEWRLWLKENHHKEKVVWLVYYKKHTGKPRIPYDDAVEEALNEGANNFFESLSSAKTRNEINPWNNEANSSGLCPVFPGMSGVA
jgi:uncharacterized protein YdeI (YjbR/CyaY-like superfamily)